MKINKSFQNLLMPLTADEKAGLEKSILQNGVIDPLIVWQDHDTLIDGHNRHEICERHNLPYDTVELAFPDEQAVEKWIIDHQLSRRNLTPEQASYLRGKRYNAEKRQDGGHGDQKSGGQNVPPKDTALGLADDYKVSDKTIKRDGKYTEAVEQLDAIEPGLKDAILSRDSGFTKKDVQEIAKTAKTEPEKAKQIIENKTHNHRAQGTGKNEWYTPIEFIDMAREVLGEINLDPASSDFANKAIMADIFFDIETDGLKKEWFGNVWLNPPYTQPDITNFAKKMFDECEKKRVKSAIILTHNYTETQWFSIFARLSSAMCFPKKRISFIDQNGIKASPTQGQCFFYYGQSPNDFKKVFSKIGLILKRF